MIFIRAGFAGCAVVFALHYLADDALLLLLARVGAGVATGAMIPAFIAYSYEQGGPPQVVAVEYKDIEPNTDVDMVLSGDVYVQVWHGKMPLGYTIDEHLWSGKNGPLDMDWCEELKPVEKKLRQLPSNTGKAL